MMAKVDTMPNTCNICGGLVEYIENSKIYGKSYGSGYCYHCTKCNAYVGTHKTSPKVAMGLLANKRMRTLKMNCHDIFDKYWSNAKERNALYRKLAEEMVIPQNECHFGWFDETLLEKALVILKNWEANV